MSTDFGKRLKAARKSAGLSQVKLSKAVGIGQSTIAELEKEGFGTSHVVKIAAVCGVSAVWLSTGEGEMVPSDLISTSALGGGLSVANISPGQAQTLAQALETVVAALAKVPVDSRKAVADDMGLLAMAPDSSETLARLSASLAPARQEARLPSAESHEFQPPEPPSMFLKNTEKT